jgi:hypothetical protein
MARGAVPAWTVEASSAKVTSLIWCEEFSTPQCPRIAPARSAGPAYVGTANVRGTGDGVARLQRGWGAFASDAPMFRQSAAVAASARAEHVAGADDSPA